MVEEITLSAVLIVKDEEHVLQRCLNSIRNVVSEIVVVDTGSKDKTKDIASGCGAKIFDMAWVNDFSIARNFGLTKASGDWILHIDADEYLPPETRIIIERLDLVGSDIFKLDLIEESGEFLAHYPRLFRRSSVAGYKGRIHETLDILPGARVVDLPASIIHSGYSQGEINLKNKAQRNLDLLSLALKDDPLNARTNYLYGRELDRRSSKDAEIYYQRSLDSRQGSSDLYKFFATFLAKTGRALKALKVAEQGLSLYPANDELNYLRGLIYLDLDDHDRALEVFESYIGDNRLSVQSGSTNSDQIVGSSSQMIIPLNLIWRGIGLVHKGKGDTKASVKAFAHALSLEPTDDTSRQLIVEQLRDHMTDPEIDVFVKSILSIKST